MNGDLNESPVNGHASRTRFIVIVFEYEKVTRFCYCHRVNEKSSLLSDHHFMVFYLLLFNQNQVIQILSGNMDIISTNSN